MKEGLKNSEEIKMEDEKRVTSEKEQLKSEENKEVKKEDIIGEVVARIWPIIDFKIIS